MSHTIIIVFSVAGLLLRGGTYSEAQTSSERLQEGLRLEEVKGEPEKAIAVYQDIIARFASDKEVAAKAQLHIGFCYEKLGEKSRKNATTAFRAVIDNYPDQTISVEAAREKLKTLEGGLTQEDAVRRTIAEFNLAYESKDVDKWSSFFSKDLLDRISRGDKAVMRGWKDRIKMENFSPWKSIRISSTIIQIEKQGYNFLVKQERSISGTDWNGKEHLIKPKGMIYLTMKNENGSWKMGESREVSLPEIYEKLTADYQGAGQPGLAYVCHITQSYVSVIDTRTNRLVGIIPCGNGSNDIAFSPDGERGYIGCFNSNDVTVFDRKTNRTIAEVPAGDHPMSLVVTPDSRKVLVSHQSNDNIWVLDTKTNSIVRHLDEGWGNLQWAGSGTILYQSQVFRPFVYRIDPNTLSISRKISVGGRPLGLAFTPDGRYAYIANFDLNELEKIDTQADSVVARLGGVQGPRGIAITPDGKLAYVTNVQQGRVSVVDLDKQTLIKEISVGAAPTSVAITPDGTCAYVSCQGASKIAVIDLARNEVVQSIEVADNPISISIPQEKGRPHE